MAIITLRLQFDKIAIKKYINKIDINSYNKPNKRIQCKLITGKLNKFIVNYSIIKHFNLQLMAFFNFISGYTGLLNIFIVHSFIHYFISL